MVTENDSDFLEKVYFYTRKDEFAMLGWSDEQLAVFLKMQFQTQQQSYEMQFPKAEKLVIKIDDYEEIKSIGQIIVDRNEREIRLVDISFLPEFRGIGSGTKVIGDLVAEAENKKLPLTLTVLHTNIGAFRLYKKLGFKVKSEDEIYILMER